MNLVNKCGKWLIGHTAVVVSACSILFLAFMALVTYKFEVSFVSAAENYGFTAKLYWGFIALILIQMAVMVYLQFIRVKKLAIEIVAIVTVAFWGLVFMFLLPPFSSPDEDTTYVSCYALSNVMLGKEAANEEGFVYMRACDVDGVLHRKPGRDDYRTIADQLFTKADHTEMVLCSIQKQNQIFWIFLPQAVGISIARILGLGQVPLLFMARLVNFAVFLALFWFALRRMPFGKHILFVIACFPMVLEQISSMSYDAFIIGLSFYFIALVLDLIYRQERVSIKDSVLMVASMVVLAPMKVIYCMFSFLCLLIPRKKFGTTKRYILTICIMVVGVSASILAAQSHRFVEYLTGTNATISYDNSSEDKLVSYEEALENGNLSADTTVLYTFSDILHNKKRMIGILGNTIRLQGHLYLEQMIGGYLGWLEIDVPSIVIFGFFAIFLAICFRRREDPVPTAGQKTDYFLVTAAVILLAYLFMLVGHTCNGANYCMGLQGRYFLPTLPLVPLIFWTKGASVGDKPMITLANVGSQAAEKDYRHWQFVPTITLMINMLLTWTFMWVFMRIVTRLGSNV